MAILVHWLICMEASKSAYLSYFLLDPYSGWFGTFWAETGSIGACWWVAGPWDNKGTLTALLFFTIFFSDKKARHLVNLKKSRIVNFRLIFVSKWLKNGSETTENGPKWTHWTLPGSLCVICYQLVSVFGRPGKCIKINAKIVARYRIFRTSRFLYEIFLKSLYWLGNQLASVIQVLAKTCQTCRLFFGHAQYWYVLVHLTCSSVRVT